jgi:predicted kinase
MKKVTIIRGPSGAGKGTWIRNNLQSSIIVSADMFFMEAMPEGGFEYKFDITKLSEAHAWCMAEFLKALNEGVESIVVDNTNIKHWQFEHYVLGAKLAGYDVEVVSLMGFTIQDIKLCASRNLHRTPIEVVAKMFLEFEPYEGETVVMINGSES